MQGVKERADLPAAEVAGEEEHSFAALLGGFEILEALIDRDLRSILRRVAREEADLAQQAAQRHVHAAQNLAPLFLWFSPGRPVADCASPRAANAGADDTPARQ